MLFPVYTGSNKIPSSQVAAQVFQPGWHWARLAGARARVKANQAVIQDSPGHLQSILAQSQLKLTGSVEGHQFPYKLKAILKSKQSQCGLHWFNGSSLLECPVKSARRTQGGQVTVINAAVCVEAVWHFLLILLSNRILCKLSVSIPHTKWKQCVLKGFMHG